MVEHRHARRKPPAHAIDVTNAITEEVVGQIGNLSTDGMMLIANRPMPEDALFQFIFQLPGKDGQPRVLELGVHEQWTEAVQAPGQFWAGYRIIDIGEHDYSILHDWVHSSENRYG
jgi:hypothetical protein